MRIARARLVPAVVVVLVAAALLVVPTASAATASSRPDDTYVTNGRVEAVVRAGDTVYIGGQFDRVGARTGPGVEVGLDGSLNPGLPEISGAGPSSIVGSGGQPRAHLAGLHAADGTATAFDPSPVSNVAVLAVSGSTVYAAGFFSQIGGETRHLVAGLDGVDGGATSFDPRGSGLRGVRARGLRGQAVRRRVLRHVRPRAHARVRAVQPPAAVT